MPSLKKIIFTAFFSLIIIFSGYFVVFAWTAPTSAPPNGNIAAPLNTGSVTQSKTGGLNVSGNVGIGTTNPVTKLEVAGSTHIGRADSSDYLRLSRYSAADPYAYISAKQSPSSAGTAGLKFEVNNAGAPSNVTIDSSGNVGIGTAAPGDKLEVSGGVRATDFRFPQTGYITYNVLNSGSQALIFRNYGTETMRIDSTGNVGIGTANPANKLVVQMPSATAFETAGVFFKQGDDFDGMIIGGKVHAEKNIDTYYGKLYLNVESGNDISMGSTISRVGIGTTDPEAKLEVAGNVKIQGSINRGPTNLPLFRWLPIGIMATYSGAGNGPYGIAFDGVNMWTANPGNNSVTKITPTGAMTSYTVTDNPRPRGIAFDGTNMWIANNNRDSVTKITPTGAMTTYYGIGDYPIAIAFDGVNMWTANWWSNSVTKITPTGAMTTYTGTGSNPQAIAFDGINMWTANSGVSSVTKITPTGAMTTYSGTGPGPYGIAFDGVNMWTANYYGNSVTKITPTGAMTTYSGTGPYPRAIAFDGVNMWTANSTGSSVTKITPTGAMTTYSGTGNSPYGIAFDGTNMWTANYDGNSVTKILVITQ